MLNQQGGQVLFGVTPEGRATGQQDGERTIEEIDEELGRIDPSGFPTIERIPLADDREVVGVTVNRGQARPYMYLGAAHRRVGNTTAEMRADEYRRMLFEHMHSEQRWENRLAGGWSAVARNRGCRRVRDRAVPSWRGIKSIATNCFAWFAQRRLPE